jgi:hypothetical protein
VAVSNEIAPGEENRELVISLEPNLLGDFILGLLGQRRSIEQHFNDRYFLVDLKWLLNLDDIIDQRISAQNAGTLVSFGAKIYFDDGRITNLTSRIAFRSFHDISSRIAIGLDLGWTHLIQFPNVKVPEKQEIRFRAFTDLRAASQKPNAKASTFFLASSEQKQELYFSVSFTDLTWGEDMANHVSTFVRSKTRRLDWITRIVRSVDVKTLTPLIFTFGMFGSLYFSERDNFSQQVLEKYRVTRPENLSRLDTNGRLSFLVDATAAQLLRNKDFLWPIIKLFALFFLLSFMMWALGARKASYISLNEHSEAYFSRINHRFEIVKYGVVLASVVGIVGGIFANTIYDYLKALHLF